MKHLGRLAMSDTTKWLPLLVLIFTSACNAPQTGVLRAQLAFRISGDGGLTAARDLTVDQAGNVFIFDYGDYVIRKFDPEGRQLAAFGGTGEEPGLFLHLMAIQAQGDSLVALDAGSLSVFGLSGEFRSRGSFVDTVVCDLPRIRADGQWACEWIIQETAEKALTYRAAEGAEAIKLASYSLGAFFPGLEPGEMFFINPTQLRSYLYDFATDGRLVWAVSDRLQVFSYDDGIRRQLFAREAAAIPFPREAAAVLESRQASLGAPFFLNVPTDYQIIQHLLVDKRGDIWLYVTSQEQTGFLRISATGKLLGSYRVETEFDALAARIAVANGKMYFLVPGHEETGLYTLELP